MIDFEMVEINVNPIIEKQLSLMLNQFKNSAEVTFFAIKDKEENGWRLRILIDKQYYVLRKTRINDTRIFKNLEYLSTFVSDLIEDKNPTWMFIHNDQLENVNEKNS